jgi:(2Fe-2S) ferredoxin
MDVMTKFYEELQTRNLFDEILVTGSTCIGPCDLGPTVIVYPGAVWYSRVTPDDVGEIMTKHLVEGKPVERLLMPQSAWEG